MLHEEELRKNLGIEEKRSLQGLLVDQVEKRKDLELELQIIKVWVFFACNWASGLLYLMSSLDKIKVFHIEGKSSWERSGER